MKHSNITAVAIFSLQCVSADQGTPCQSGTPDDIQFQPPHLVIINLKMRWRDLRMN